MNFEDITWSPLIPLIGGFPLGTEAALGKPPEQIVGYGFGNDEHYINYQNNTMGRNIPHVILNEDGSVKEGQAIKKVNIVVATPACSALSQLNCNPKNPLVSGATAESTKWMDYSVRDSIEFFNADVLIIENAPTLYTNKGKEMAKRLYETAKKYGYSSSFYKTSTEFHGIPQCRDRTFFFGWKSKTAPILPWFKRERKDFKEYLEEIPSDTLHQNEIINPKVVNEPCYVYCRDVLKMEDPRTTIRQGKVAKTAFKYILTKGELDNALAWATETNNERGIKLFSHAKKKFADGKGIWDGSVHCFGETMNACIGRNLTDTIHPTEDRSLTVREALHMMGHPHNFELLGGLKRYPQIAQNVPVCTARDMVLAASQWLCGELEDSGLDLMYQSNFRETFDTKPKGQSLDNFFCG